MINPKPYESLKKPKNQNIQNQSKKQPNQSKNNESMNSYQLQTS